MARIQEFYERYHEQLSHPQKVTEGADCPFFSLSNLANHSRLFFGPHKDMNPDVWHETARRILIVREFILSNEPRMIDISFLEERILGQAKFPKETGRPKKSLKQVGLLGNIAQFCDVYPENWQNGLLSTILIEPKLLRTEMTETCPYQ